MLKSDRDLFYQDSPRNLQAYDDDDDDYDEFDDDDDDNHANDDYDYDDGDDSARDLLSGKDLQTFWSTWHTLHARNIYCS